jgi:hypothetical protein
VARRVYAAFHYKNPAPASSGKLIETDSALGAMARRIRILQDIEEIENLISTYGYHLDKQRWNLLTDLFVEALLSKLGFYIKLPIRGFYDCLERY